MILAFDTYYFDYKAKTVCISFDNWKANKVSKIQSETLDNIEDYISGEFYKRELPCILSLISRIDLTNAEFIIVDGFVFLDDEQKYGLGAHLYKALTNNIPVIGVAKTNFATIKKQERKLLRGKSNRPLFITAIGIDVDEAVTKIESMDGEYRIPTLLKELDKLTKEK
jgi:exodeoxyribonuclease-5/deoxyribonuclease V